MRHLVFAIGIFALMFSGGRTLADVGCPGNMIANPGAIEDQACDVFNAAKCSTAYPETCSINDDCCHLVQIGSYFECKEGPGTQGKQCVVYHYTCAHKYSKNCGVPPGKTTSECVGIGHCTGHEVVAACN